MLDVFRRAHYAGNFMRNRGLSATIATVALAISVPVVCEADDATLLRVFLKDGTSLVSYGEPARVADRVIFSMPTASTPNPPLHLVDLSVERVDWERTERYANGARTAHYIATQADSDYAELSNQITQVLNDVSLTPEPVKRLAIVEGARKMLADWPQNHYNYRQTEVRQMLMMLDEAIADLRAATGSNRFSLALVTSTETSVISEPLLPAPTPQEAIEDVLKAAQVVDSAAERTSLLTMALVSIEREKEVLPPSWLDTTRKETSEAIKIERHLDKSYQSMTGWMMILAGRRAKDADVRGLERLIARIDREDALLGRKRPDAMKSLMAAVEEKLDVARRLQLARDRWALLAPAYDRYHAEIARPIDLFLAIKPSLDNIKTLAGSTPASLMAIESVVAEIVKIAAGIVPPQDFAGAHALLVSAAQLAGNAARIRREAIMAGDLKRAWDASSAAAGSLMLGARATNEIQALLRPPQLK
jgi:hypothetical protein